MSDEIQKSICKNDVLVGELNQLLHNSGVEFSERLEFILPLVRHIYMGEAVDDDLTVQPFYTRAIEILTNTTIPIAELYQKMFMFYANKITKVNLDQFYTPITIGVFINALCKKNKRAIDPACGTGDLLINYPGQKTLWDISPEVIRIAEYNFSIQKAQHDAEFETKDTLRAHTDGNGQYNYAFLNPPFGSSTVIRDPEILKHYQLGQGQKKQEIGMLFIERTMNLLSKDGIAYIILPNGYLGNTNKNTVALREYLLRYRIVAVIGLPSNTFMRSGTGVSTSLLIVAKQTPPPDNYSIFVRKINNIGYHLNKKNTPYKYLKVGGEYVLDGDGRPRLDNELDACAFAISNFIRAEKVKNMATIPKSKCKGYEYDTVAVDDLDEFHVLDVHRHVSTYKNVIEHAVACSYRPIRDFIEADTNEKFDVENNKEYVYLDIKQVNTPIYNTTNTMYGYELPARAKIQLRKHDIILSRLRGRLTFTIILDDVDNLVCTNGFCLLRPKSYDDAVRIFASLFRVETQIQHNSFCTGSIMETITNERIKNILIPTEVDMEKYNSVIDALGVIRGEL